MANLATRINARITVIQTAPQTPNSNILENKLRFFSPSFTSHADSGQGPQAK